MINFKIWLEIQHNISTPSVFTVWHDRDFVYRVEADNIFGNYNAAKKLKIKDKIFKKFATTNLISLSNMLSWIDNSSYENNENYEKLILKIKTIIVDFNKKNYKTSHHDKTDLDEIFVIEGEIVDVIEGYNEIHEFLIKKLNKTYSSYFTDSKNSKYYKIPKIK